MQLTELDDDPAAPFPALEKALREPDGLLAWGGDLSVTRLLGAYRHGCFPWFSEGQPLLWWAPDPRMVLGTDAFHVSRSLRRFRPWLRRRKLRPRLLRRRPRLPVRRNRSSRPPCRKSRHRGVCPKPAAARARKIAA